MSIIGEKRALRNEAIRELVKIGLLIPVSSVDLYHGRTNLDSKDWVVLKNFNNGDNATGHLNTNLVPALNIAENKTASEFAAARERIEGGTREVHKIVPIEDNLYIINTEFDKNELKRKEVQSLMQELLAPDASKKSISVKFEDRKVFDSVSRRMRNNGLFVNFIDRDTSSKYIENNKFSEKERDIAMEIIKAINSKMLCQTNIIEAITRYMGGNYGKTMGKDGKLHPLGYIMIGGKKYDFSTEYISSFLSENNIIGRFSLTFSETLGKDIDAYQVFDLEKINTEKEVGERLRSAADSYSVVTDLFMDKKGNLNLMKLSKSPEEIMEYVRGKSRTADALFWEQVGLWEGFELGEHTESVLRFFDDNFSACLPARTRGMMNLMIICHDIGKPVALQKGIKRGTFEEVKIYKETAAAVCKELGAKEPLSDFIIDFIFKTQKHTTDFYVGKNPNALEELDASCKGLLKEYGIEDKEGLSESLTQFARVLQTCDSGAYTIYGKTRKTGTDTYFQNGNKAWSREFVNTEHGYRFEQDSKLVITDKLNYRKSHLL